MRVNSRLPRRVLGPTVSSTSRAMSACVAGTVSAGCAILARLVLSRMLNKTINTKKESRRENDVRAGAGRDLVYCPDTTAAGAHAQRGKEACIANRSPQTLDSLRQGVVRVAAAVGDHHPRRRRRDAPARQSRDPVGRGAGRPDPAPQSRRAKPALGAAQPDFLRAWVELG